MSKELVIIGAAALAGVMLLSAGGVGGGRGGSGGGSGEEAGESTADIVDSVRDMIINIPPFVPPAAPYTPNIHDIPDSKKSRGIDRSAIDPFLRAIGGDRLKGSGDAVQMSTIDASKFPPSEYLKKKPNGSGSSFSLPNINPFGGGIMARVNIPASKKAAVKKVAVPPEPPTVRNVTGSSGYGGWF